MSYMVICPILNKEFSNSRFWKCALTRLKIKKDEQKTLYDKLWLHINVCKFPGCCKNVPFAMTKLMTCCVTHSNQYLRIKKGDYKLEDLKYECKLDGLKFLRPEDLGDHLRKNYKYKDHDMRNYYDTFYKKEEEGLCKWCGKETSFQSVATGYSNFCYNSDCNVRWHNKNTDRLAVAGAGIKKAHSSGQSIPTQLGYWLKKGLNEEEALLCLKSRQTTNSVPSIMQRGDLSLEEALQVRKEITKKWSEKTHTGLQYSKVSQELFCGIYDGIKDLVNKDNIFFATFDGGKVCEDKKLNKEYRFIANKSVYKLDFYISEIKLCIEFDGEYWHSGSWKNKRRLSDEDRDEELCLHGIEILRVKERNFRNDKIGTIESCVKFIYERLANSTRDKS